MMSHAVDEDGGGFVEASVVDEVVLVGEEEEEGVAGEVLVVVVDLEEEEVDFKKIAKAYSEQNLRFLCFCTILTRFTSKCERCPQFMFQHVALPVSTFPWCKR